MVDFRTLSAVTLLGLASETVLYLLEVASETGKMSVGSSFLVGLVEVQVDRVGRCGDS